MTGYYRKFIKNYDQIAAPLTALLKKNAFAWSDAADLAFQHLKVAVSQPLVLALPNFNQHFIIECDASGTGLGAVLMQNQRPIAFHTQTLKGKALQLSTYEKELLALVTAVHKWRPYLLGRPFIIKIDQKSLKYILEQKIATPAQQKWLTKLLGYLFVVEYKRGCENKVADALSRRSNSACEASVSPSVSASDSACEASISPSVSASHPTLFLILFPCPSWIEELKDSYKQNPELQQLLQQLKSGSNYPRLFSLHNDLILYKGRVFLGTQCSLKSKILHLVHDSPLVSVPQVIP